MSCWMFRGWCIHWCLKGEDQIENLRHYDICNWTQQCTYSMGSSAAVSGCTPDLFLAWCGALPYVFLQRTISWYAILSSTNYLAKPICYISVRLLFPVNVYSRLQPYLGFYFLVLSVSHELNKVNSSGITIFATEINNGHIWLGVVRLSVAAHLIYFSLDVGQLPYLFIARTISWCAILTSINYLAKPICYQFAFSSWWMSALFSRVCVPSPVSVLWKLVFNLGPSRYINFHSCQL